MTDFRKLHDRLLPATVSAMSWCPKMDIIVLATGDTMLSVHRLSWQAVFSAVGATASSRGKGYEPDTAAITRIVWRPDGHVLATGLQDGTVTLRLVEGGETLSQLENASAITALQWVQLVPDSSTIEPSRPLDRLLLPLLPLVRDVLPVPTAQVSAAAAALRVAENPPSSLDVLVCADKQGTVTLSAFGVFGLGSVSLDRINIPLSDPEICQVCLSSNLHTLALAVKGNAPELDSGTETKQLWLAVIDTSILKAKQNELRDLATHAATLLSLIAYVSDVIDALSDQWHEGRGLFDAQVKELEKLLETHGELDRCPRAEFTSLLCSGMAGPALTQFIENTLGSRGLAKLKKQVLSAYRECEKLCGDLLKRAGDRVLYVASVLSALAQWRDRYAAIGHKPDATARLSDAAKLLIVRVSHVYGELVSSRRQFEIFFAWMDRVLHKMMDEDVTSEVKPDVDISAVAAFFGSEGVFEHEKTGHQFTAEGLSLRQIVSNLYECMSRVLAAPSEKMTQTFAPVTTVQLCSGDFNVGPFHQTDERWLTYSKQTEICVVRDNCRELDHGNSLLMSPSLWPGGRVEANLSCARLQLRNTIIDFDVKKDGSLCVLSRDGNVTDLSVYYCPDFEPIKSAQPVFDDAVASRQVDNLACALSVGERGTACVLIGQSNKRVIIFDLEDEEDEEDDD